jgi:crotonobetainyl-CoA:carnitine CoA-transferase CaiB-like acyl-CoA transferase
MTLGDLGAAIIKVERPGTGDETRSWGPPFDAEGESAYFLSVNRNKLSVAIDLDVPDDRRLLERLISGADVVLENFRQGSLERHGIDADRFLETHPRLIWCGISGFGPLSDRPGYDFVVQAECGWMAITGEARGAPMKTGVALADVIAGKEAALSILAVLHARDAARDPLPIAARRLHVSLAHTATAALVNVAQNVLVSGDDAARWGNGHPNLVPYQVFQAADRALVVAVGSDVQWVAACRALGLDDLAADPALATNAGRVRQRDRVVSAFSARLATRPAEDWLGRFEAAGVPGGVVRSVAEALRRVAASPRTGLAPAPPGTIRHPPPRLDEHGALVRALGWDAFGRLAPWQPRPT